MLLLQVPWRSGEGKEGGRGFEEQQEREREMVSGTGMEEQVEPRRGQSWERGGDSLESNDVITRLHGCDALANRLDDTGSLVSQDDGESTLWVLA